MIGFGNDTLNKQPALKKGDKIVCPLCGEQHTVVTGKDADTGDDTDLVMFYKCEGKAYLAGVAGRSVVGVSSDLSTPISEPQVLETYPKPVERAQMPDEAHRQRHEQLHLMFDELLADYMLHNPGARPSSTKAMDLMLWSAQQCKEPGGKHPAQASDGALSFNALAMAFMTEMSGGDMRKRIGPEPLPPQGYRRPIGRPPVEQRKCALCGGPGPFRTDEEIAKETGGKFTWTDTCTYCEKQIPMNERYDCPQGGKCWFTRAIQDVGRVTHICEQCGRSIQEIEAEGARQQEYDCSEGGKCQFVMDLEYDSTGQTISCEKCGCTPEEKARGEK